jgi:hypothetical protein
MWGQRLPGEGGTSPGHVGHGLWWGRTVQQSHPDGLGAVVAVVWLGGILQRGCEAGVAPAFRNAEALTVGAPTL